jgi:3-oxoadipate enol-lactonase
VTALHHTFTGPHDAPVLVLASSLGTRAAMWEPQIEALSDTWRVLAYDHRGHGASPVPPAPWEIADIARDALELLDAHGIERASFCGLSLGAMAGMWLAAHAPARIDRLVLCCTTAYFPDKDLWRERAEAAREAGMEGIADTVVERWLTPAYAGTHPAVRRRLRDMLVATPADGYVAACGAIERMDLRDDLASISVPTRVIAGLDDPATPLEHLQRIAAAIPGARLEVVPAAAHLANVEQASAVTRLIRDHIEEAR